MTFRALLAVVKRGDNLKDKEEYTKVWTFLLSRRIDVLKIRAISYFSLIFII